MKHCDCGHVIYKTKKDAETALRAIKNRRKKNNQRETENHTYQCPYGNWHLHR